jgi:type II secretory pathway predicted ATPase ExeA/septal ring-binding cell division protein DamX
MMEDINYSESVSVSPFQEEIVLENYFDGANRGEVLAQMVEAIKNEEEAVFIVLTGDDGSGKTMMCRLLEQRALSFGLCKTVFFPRTVDSFDDVVHCITSELSPDEWSDNTEDAVDWIVSFLLGQSVELLVIFDEAENMFLATLERIRKMFDRVSEAGARMHILFSGRKTFLENCDQLSLCDFQKSNELYFALTPLSENETVDYLENCVVRLPGSDGKKVFTDEVVDNIYSLAQGNFRITNMLGEESMKIHGGDTSFMVLLESVKDGGVKVKKQPDEGKHSHIMRGTAAYLPWIGGAVGCFLLLFYLFGSGHETNNVKPVDVAPVIAGKATVAEIEMEPVSPETKVDIELADEEKPVSGQALDPLIEVPPENIQAMHTESAAWEEPENETADVAETEVAQPPTAEKKQDIVQLHSVDDVKKKAEFSPVSRPVLEQQVIKREPRAKIRKVTSAVAHFPAAQLYNERVSAGSAWAKKEKQDKYTVQLMLLASETAEENLKNMLARDNYRQEAGNFYIFKKTAMPENIFVFYGEYPTMERARLVKNSLPEFLLKYKPYALSIKEAMVKVEK